MPVNLNLVANRLRQARETLQYTIEETSQATGIASERIIAIECAKEMPTGDDILILAHFYDCDFLSFIDEDLPPPAQQSDFVFRRYGKSFSADDRRNVQEFLNLCQLETSLERLLEIRVAPFSFSPSGSYLKRHGQDAAEALRRHLGHKHNEAWRDVYSDFRSIGIHIFRRKLSNKDISGLYVNDKIAGHCVLINYSEDLYRQRFSVAHEVAHAIFDSGEGALLTYEWGSALYDKSDQQEIRANSFASHYLMPITMLNGLSKLDDEGARYWAQQFRVSTSALAKALKDAGRIDAEEARRIRAVRVPKDLKIDPEAPEFLNDTQRARRTALLERGLSTHYVDLCFMAHDRGKISTGRLAEMLRVDLVELSEIGVLYGRKLSHGV